MNSLRLWNKWHLYRICLCGVRSQVIQRNVSLFLVDNKRFHTLSANLSNAEVQNDLRKKIIESVVESGERYGRYDSIGLTDKALVQLRTSVMKSGRIYKADIERILQDVKTKGVPVHSYELLLIQCCGELIPDELPEVRVELAHKVWNTLKEIGVIFNERHYNALLRSYAENSHPVSLTRFLSDMGDVEPTETTYQLLLACLCEVGDIEGATELIAIMKKKGCHISEPIFNALILGHARAGDMESSLGMLDMMFMSKIPTSADTYVALLQSLAEAGDISRLHKYYREAVMKNLVFSDRDIMKIVKSLSISGLKDAVKNVLKWLPVSSKGERTHINHMMVHLMHLGHEDVALCLLDVLPVPAEHTFGMLIFQEMIKLDKPLSGMLLLADKLMADGRNPLALQMLVGASLGLMRVETSLALFEVLRQRGVPLRSHYFWPLIIAASNNDGEAGVFSIIKEMQKFGVGVNFETLQDYILPRLTLVDEQVVIRKLQDYGLSVATTLSPLLAVFLMGGHLKTAVKLCDKHKGHLQSDKLVLPLVSGYVATRDVKLTVKMLQEMTSRCGQVNDWTGEFIIDLITLRKIALEPEQLCQLLKAFQEVSLNISSFAADMVKVYLQNKVKAEALDKMTAVTGGLVKPDLNIVPSENLSTHIPHPAEMALDDMESHLIELESKSLNKRGLLRRLLQRYCRDRNAEQALRTKKEFETCGYEFSAGMLAMLFDLMIQVGNVEEAEKNLQDLKKLAPEFVVDEHKLLDYTTLLIEHNRLEDGLLMLEQYAESHPVKGGNAVSRNCWRLLSALAEKKDGKETRRVLEKLAQLGYCSINNILLGPVIKAYINRNDLKGAVEEYKRIAAKHKATPMQYELLCQLLKSSNLEMTEEVLEATRSVHGDASTDATLAMALAELGYMKELQRLLLTFKSQKQLIIRCKRMVEENKLEVLENLIVAGRGLNWFNVHPIYMLMLKIYIRRSDCDGALNLWTSIQERGDKPSILFLVKLAALLKSHKRSIPFVVPEDKEYASLTEPPQTPAFSRYMGRNRR